MEPLRVFWKGERRVAFKFPVIKRWSSHIAILLRVVAKSTGTVIECGSGVGSTLSLHWVCMEKGVKLITYETNFKYFQFANQFRSKTHRIKLVDSWASLIPQRVGVLFLDQAPGHARGLMAVQWKDMADYIVMHDTEPQEGRGDYFEKYRRKNPDFDGTDVYNYDPMWEHFPHRYTTTHTRAPWTSVVSRTHDVSWLETRAWP